MTQLTAASDEVLALAEERLRVLHALRPEVRLQPDFEAQYVAFVRALRERVHPRGVRDVRTVGVEGGLTFQVDLGDRLGCDVFYGYYDERFEASLFAIMLDPGATVLDVGANFGYYAVLCAGAAGPSGVVHAFEPDPAAYDLLTANAAANGLTECLHGHPAAVGYRDGTVAYHLAEEAAFSGISATGRSGTRGVAEVPLRSLDSFATGQDIEQIDALKIDVEGHEADVLAGGRALIGRSADPLLMLEVTAKNLTDAGREALTAELDHLYGQGFHGLLPDLASPAGLRAVPTAGDAAGLASANLFLVRAGDDRERRLRAAVRDRLASSSPAFEARPADADQRPIRLYQGLDPDLVSAALRDKSDAEARASTLGAQNRDLQTQIEQLRAERAALRAEVRRLSTTPLGLAVKAARLAGRALRVARPPAR